MEISNLEIVKTLYETFTNGNMDRWFSHLSADALLREATSLPYGGDHHGHEAIATVFGEIGRLWNDFSFENINMFADGDVVMSFGRFSAVGRATGRRATMFVAERWVLKDGKVVEILPIFSDTALLLEALNTSEIES